MIKKINIDIDIPDIPYLDELDNEIGKLKNLIYTNDIDELDNEINKLFEEIEFMKNYFANI